MLESIYIYKKKRRKIYPTNSSLFFPSSILKFLYRRSISNVRIDLYKKKREKKNRNPSEVHRSTNSSLPRSSNFSILRFISNARIYINKKIRKEHKKKQGEREKLRNHRTRPERIPPRGGLWVEDAEKWEKSGTRSVPEAARKTGRRRFIIRE